jgi:hypothetical protein
MQPNKYRHSYLAVSAITLLGISLTSCSTMRTVDADVQAPVTHKARVGNFYFLPRGVIRIVGEPVENNAFKVTISKFNVPDPTSRYFLKQEMNPFFDDHTMLEVDQQGLLTTTNVESEDKTSEIIDKVTETIINVAKISANLGSSIVPLTAEDVGQPPALLPFNCTFDPLVPSDVARARNVLRDAGFRLRVGGASGSKTVTATVTKAPASGGVFYRPPLVVHLTVETAIEGVPPVVEKAAVRIPDPAEIAVFSLSRPFLVKKTTNLAFIGGDLKTMDFKKPSEALAFVTIPASVTGKIAEAIPSIIKIQDSRANAGLVAEKAHLDAQKGVLDSQLALRKSQQAILDSAPPGVAPASAGPTSANPNRTESMTIREQKARAKAAEAAAAAEQADAEVRKAKAEFEKTKALKEIEALKNQGQ